MNRLHLIALIYATVSKRVPIIGTGSLQGPFWRFGSLLGLYLYFRVPIFVFFAGISHLTFSSECIDYNQLDIWPDNIISNILHMYIYICCDVCCCCFKRKRINFTARMAAKARTCPDMSHVQRLNMMRGRALGRADKTAWAVLDTSICRQEHTSEPKV